MQVTFYRFCSLAFQNGCALPHVLTINSVSISEKYLLKNAYFCYAQNLHHCYLRMSPLILARKMTIHTLKQQGF